MQMLGRQGTKGPSAQRGGREAVVEMPMPNGWRAAPSLAGEGEGGRILSTEGRCWFIVVAAGVMKPSRERREGGGRRG